MPDPREYHSMTCPHCAAEVLVREEWEHAMCPECDRLCEVSWDGAPDGGSGLIPINEEPPCH